MQYPQRARRLLLAMVVLAIAAAPLRARGQKFIEGLWLGVEDGGVIELIAWAETVRYGAW